MPRRSRRPATATLGSFVVKHFVHGQEAVAVAVDLVELVQRAAADFPLIQTNLGILVGIELREPIGQPLGQFADAIGHGLLALGECGAVAGVLVVFIPFQNALLNARLHPRLELVEIDQAILVGVPLVQFGPEVLGHLIMVEDAVAVDIVALELALHKVVETVAAAAWSAPATTHARRPRCALTGVAAWILAACLHPLLHHGRVKLTLAAAASAFAAATKATAT